MLSSGEGTRTREREFVILPDRFSGSESAKPWRSIPPPSHMRRWADLSAGRTTAEPPEAAPPSPRRRTPGADGNTPNSLLNAPTMERLQQPEAFGSTASTKCARVLDDEGSTRAWSRPPGGSVPRSFSQSLLAEAGG